MQRHISAYSKHPQVLTNLNFQVSWTAGGGGRQLIHLDAQTHAQLQQMNPQQRAMFVAQLQKRRQLNIQRAQAQALAHQQVTKTPGLLYIRTTAGAKVETTAGNESSGTRLVS